MASTHALKKVLVNKHSAIRTKCYWYRAKLLSNSLEENVIITFACVNVSETVHRQWFTPMMLLFPRKS